MTFIIKRRFNLVDVVAMCIATVCYVHYESWLAGIATSLIGVAISFAVDPR